MIVAVVGNHHPRCRETVFEVLSKIHRKTPIQEVVYGSENGTERYAKEFAQERGIRLTYMPPCFRLHGGRARAYQVASVCCYLAESSILQKQAISFYHPREHQSWERMCDFYGVAFTPIDKPLTFPDLRRKT